MEHENWINKEQYLKDDKKKKKIKASTINMSSGGKE